MEVRPTFNLKGIDYPAIIRLFTGQLLPTDRGIHMIYQNTSNNVTTNGKIDPMLYNAFNKIPEGSGIIAPVGRMAVVSHTLSIQSVPENGICYHCRRHRPILSGIPVSSTVSLEDGTIKYNTIPPWVCCFGCMLASARSLDKNNEYESSERLTMALFTTLNPGEYLAESPNPLLLKENGGTLTDEQYDVCDKKFHTIGITNCVNMVTKTMVATQVTH